MRRDAKLQLERLTEVVPSLETRWRTEPKLVEALPENGESLALQRQF